MRVRQLQRSLAIALVVCLAVLGVMVQVQAAEHGAHHAHHRAATHGNLLCSWLCAAGQVLDASPLVPPQVTQRRLAFVALPAFFVPDPADRFSSTRGPPRDDV